MKPPICYICHKRIENKEGGLVQFKMTEVDKIKLQKFKQKGFVGHLPALEWFCDEHIELAKKYSEFTLSEVVEKIKAEN